MASVCPSLPPSLGPPVFIFFLPETNALRPGLPALGGDLHFGAVDPQFRAVGGGVGEHVGQGAQPQAGTAGHGEPAGGDQRADLGDRAGDGGAVHPVQLCQGRVRELEPQVNDGDDDPVGERQVVVWPSAGSAQPVMTPARAQPGFPCGRPRIGEAGDEPAEPPWLQPGEDPLAQGRAGPS